MLATLAFKAMQVDHKNFSFDMVMEILSKEKSFDINVPFADLSALSILLRIQEGVVQPEVMRFYIARGMFVITKPDDFNANHDELVQGLLARGHGALLHYMLTCNGNKKNVMILSVSYRREVINRFRDLSDLFRKHTVSSASCKRCIDLTGEIIDLTDKSTEENEIDNSCGEAADHNPKVSQPATVPFGITTLLSLTPVFEPRSRAHKKLPRCTHRLLDAPPPSPTHIFRIFPFAEA